MPYWRIESGENGQQGSRSLLRSLSGAAWPTFAVLRRAAPRASIAIIVAQLVSGVATTIGLLTVAAILSHMFEGGLTPERMAGALPLIAQLVVVFLLRLASDVAAKVAKAYLIPKVRQTAESDLYGASLHASLESFDDPVFYDQLLRARDRGVMHLEGAVDSMVDVGSASFAVIGAAVALMILHPLLLAILVFALLPEGWAALASARLQYAGMPATIVLSRQAQMMAELATRRESAPEIRANQSEDYVLMEFRKQAILLQQHLIGLGLKESRIFGVGSLMSGAGLLCTFAALVWMLMAGWLGAAAAGAAVVAIRSASAEIGRLIHASNSLFERALYICDYHDFISETTRDAAARDGEAPKEMIPDVGLFEVRNIGFTYPNAVGEPALRNVSLAIKSKQIIALVGENGSGKTTLAKIIAGLYHPTSGQVLWDGIDIRRLDRYAVAANIAMVLQEPIRWPRTARENIRLGRYGREDPDDIALLAAAREAHALEVIERLPNAWETLLSKEFKSGWDLSTGQWQRLAIARGLYRDAPLVIWDEPAAPLDAKAERAVYDSLRRLSADRTVVLITHRLASIRDADMIFLMYRGEIAESGSHDELMAISGKYAELYRLQATLHAIEDSLE